MGETISNWPQLTEAERAQRTAAVKLTWALWDQWQATGLKPQIDTTPPPQPVSTLPPELPDNERAFYIGLSLGNFTIEEVSRRGNGRRAYDPRVLVTTESADPIRKRVLSETLGRRGETSHNTTQFKIYLPPEGFRYLLDREKAVNKWVLGDKSKFAPFMLGFVIMHERGKRGITLSPPPLLETIHRAFGQHFGFEMGTFRTRKDAESVYVAMKDEQYTRMIEAILDTPSVQRLPFLPALIRATQDSSSNGVAS